METTLFVQELDGVTYATADEAEADYYADADDHTGPIWSNYGGWVN
ncbi:hypothetical protein OH828_14385 [Streptomyces anulatus]